MTELDLDRLEAVAKAATPGPWSVWRHDDARLRFVSDGKENLADEVEPKDAAHIAAFDPPTVLALIAAARDNEEHRARSMLLDEAQADNARLVRMLAKRVAALAVVKAERDELRPELDQLDGVHLPAQLAERAYADLVAAAKVAREMTRQVYRACEMSAEIMRDARRTGAWEGAERVASAFERQAKNARNAYDGLTTALGNKA